MTEPEIFSTTISSSCNKEIEIIKTKEIKRKIGR
jgi:hypothetical protein